MKKILGLSLLFVLSTVFNAAAQCAMCVASVSSSLSDGRSTIGTGLNVGILYLLIMPYLLISLVIYFYRRAAKQKLKEQGLL